MSGSTIELDFTAYGERGVPLLLLHGLFGSGGNWRSIARQLAEQHRVFALDLRNHGHSPHRDTMDYGLMAADVLRFLDDQELAQAAVLGHSMGGKTAMQLALAYPERVARLTVVDIAPVAYRRDYSPYIEAMRRLDLAGLKRRADADAELTPALPDAGLRQFLLQNLVSGDKGFYWRINLDGIEDSMAALLGELPASPEARYAGPTLFLGGENSDYIRDEHHGGIRSRFSMAEFAAVAGAGHWVHAEQPQRLLECVGTFLSHET